MSKNDVSSLEPQAAADVVIAAVVGHAYKGVIKEMTELLRAGPSDTTRDERTSRWHEWYSRLGSDNQEMVNEMIEKVSYAAIFHVLTIFDGVTGTLIPNTNSFLSVQVVIYPNVRAARKDKPSRVIDVSPWRVPIEEFHDSFQQKVRGGESVSSG
jgi:hypothetical protein